VRRISVALLVLFAAAAAQAQQLYRWTDEKGRVHVTDSPPPGSARDVQERKPPAAAPAAKEEFPYELTLAMKDFPVVLYTAPGCGDGCSLARAALNKRGIPFKEVQVWDEPSNEELKKVSGANEVPTLLVGRSVQRGFEPTAFDALLDSARYPRAGLLRPRNQQAPKPPEGYVGPGDLRAEPIAPSAEEKPAPGRYAPKPPSKPQAEAPKRYAPIPGKDAPRTGPYGKPAAEAKPPAEAEQPK
jgi:glutaredoxin